MNDKQFSITIINEKNNLHKSLSISFLKFKIIVFFVLTTIVLSIITILIGIIKNYTESIEYDL